jgi:hypothetical protein
MALGLSIAPWFGTLVKARVRTKREFKEETLNVADGEQSD